MIKIKCTYALLLALVLTAALGLMLGGPLQERAKPVSTEWNGSFAEGWRQFQELTGAQKYEAASSLLDKMLARARDTRDSTEWTRCLVRYTQLRIALHGYETAVRFLKEQPWPDDWASSSILNLFYAQALTTYARSYSWEVNQREKTDSGKIVDLKAWTRDQIYEETQKAFEVVWGFRNRLGGMPASEWKEYIVPNNYPDGIRPTLRDAVSYLRVEMLADTNGWRPEQLSEIYRLNLEDLLRGVPGDVSLVDPARHPLEKISFILEDLENWHAGNRQPEAALEARLERYRHLHQHFSEAEDRKRIEDGLEQHLRTVADLPWWSEGMAQLAEFVRSGDRPDSLVRARQIAMRGSASFPQSFGGRHCLAIKTTIEAPDYIISGMRNDNPGKKSILITHKNLSKVFFRAYPIDLQRIIETSNDYNLLPSGQELEKILTAGSPALQWETSLSDTPDYRMHKTFVVPPAKNAGAYLVVASGRSDFSRKNNRLHAIHITFGDLVLVTRQYGTDAEVTVLSGSTGKPVSGAQVVLYRFDWNTRHSQRETKSSDAAGIAVFHVERMDSPYFLFARLGGQVTIDDQYIYFGQRGRVRNTTLLFTDRSIYRPAQKLFWKAVGYDFRNDESRLQTMPDRVLTVSLRDMNDQVVESKTVTTNNFGTASGEFFIPSGRTLGQWFLESGGTRVPVRVEEYKRPTFETKILDSEEPLRLNQPARINGEAKYYFGLPVSNGQVKWNVKRQAVLPWWWGFAWTANVPNSFHQYRVAGGTASLRDDGTFSFTFFPQIDERLGKNKDISYRYSVSVDVTDEGGETRSAERSFRLGFASVEAFAVMEKSFFLESDRPEIKIVRKNLDGTPKPGRGTWRIAELKVPPRTLLPAEQPLFVPEGVKDRTGYETAGDRERERWNTFYNPDGVLFQWETGVTRASGSLTHSFNGEGVIAASPLPPGAYRLIYETTDDFGMNCELRKNFVVAAGSLPLPIPAILLAEKSSYQPGEAARFLVHSGFNDQPMIFEVYRDGRCIRRTELTSGKDSSVLELPLSESDRGGLRVSLSLLRDNQFVHLENTLIVPWDNKKLKVEFSTFRDHLRPGKEETWSVKVKSMDGRDAAVPAAELLAYMYDRSLDAFVPHSPVDPIGLYPYRGESVPTRSNLGEARVQWLNSSGFSTGPGFSSPTRDYLSFYSGYGIGGVGVRGGVVGGIAAASMVSRDAISQAPARVLESASSVGRVDEPKKKAEGESRPETAGPNIELRSEFSETAFWYPHLLTNKDGSATFEFKVPDSITAWNVWIHAITRDFKSGSVSREARSIKELMVRPYLPRFLREGDEAEIKVVVNNAADKELKGSLNFDIVDVTTGESVLPSFSSAKSSPGAKPFSVPAGGGAHLTFPIRTPAKVGQVAFKVTASSGDFSDGELRPVPILPGRMHLMQSRFVTLKDPGRRVMRFEDLARNDDPTRINEQMVVTLDAQLFYSVLSALPYLVNYPYECTEQTLNRFLSTGIVSSLYQQYPAIDRMAKEFSSRQTHFEQWDAPDPNRKMALEETPWLQMAKGGKEEASDLINVLDSNVAKAQRETALARLRKSQTSSGGFPWFPGGPPSPYMTLYLLHGFSKALEFGIDVPREMVTPAWDYTHKHYLDEIVKEMMARDSGWEFVTFINYVLSNYPDSSWYPNSFTAAERKTMLDFSFKHWKAHSPYLKGYLALTLKRMGRPKDALLVWESVMDSARTAEDQGTFWAPEDRGWLWYNDTIETHAFAIRTEMELLPDDPKLDGMVLWLFLNKKMNHWKSTRATAEVIYSLAHYLKKTGQLGIREDATVTVGNQKTGFVFEPAQYTGKKNQIVIPGEKIDPQTGSSISVEKEGTGYLFASATWHFSTERLPEEERGDYLRLSRSYFKRVNTGREFSLQPIREGAALEAGDEVEVHLSLICKHPMEYVHLRDPRAAGFEPSANISRHKWDLGLSWYEEIRDSGTNFFFEHLPQGEYTFKYRIRATTAGTFRAAPATAQPMYAPEFAAYSAGAVLSIR